MRVAHWSIGNGSGMHRVAESMAKGEREYGIDSVLVNLDHPETFAASEDVDIHVTHTHLPKYHELRKKGKKIVWVGHGTPENVFMSSVENGLNKGYGFGDPWMLMMFWLQHADAAVTFWPRHAEFFRSMSDRHTTVDVIPFGVEKDFWKPGHSNGKFVGKPSILTAENCHYIKWPLDLFIAWGYISPECPEATLHSIYLPKDQHRWFFPLVNRNGCSFSSYISGAVFSHDTLLNAFRSVDYYCGLVRYGDFNRVGLEARASGCKVISYAGNPYANYWIHEGDQRQMAEELIAIIEGKAVEREPEEVPDVRDMVAQMATIYERILK